MKLRNVGSNMTELVLGRTSVLFSYETPVAGWDDKGAFRTDTRYSSTTTKHINKYLGGKDIGRTVPQSYINELVTPLPHSQSTLALPRAATIRALLLPKQFTT